MQSSSSISSLCDTVLIVLKFLGSPILFLRNDLVGATSRFFNRSWAQFTNEFGSPTAQYWIGLDRLHTMSQWNCTIRFDLWFVDDQVFYAQYSNFSVGSSSTKYRLSIGGYSGDFSDSMVKSNGQKFTTYDSDNDAWAGGNCAKAVRGGWWLENCGSSLITASSTNFAWAAYSSNPIITTYSLNSVEVRLLC